MKLLVIASDARELHGILSHAEARACGLAVDFARAARIGSYEILAAANGVGVQRATAALDAALAVFQPHILVSTGFCGALAPDLALNDIVVATEVTDGETRYPAASLENPRPYRRGVVRTSRRVAQTSTDRSILHAAGAMVVEMEAAAVARRAQSRGIPFYCIKVVTDLAGETLANDFNKALRADGHFDTIILLQGTLRHPFARIAELVRLARRCVQATRVMGDFFADCRF